MEAVSMPTHTTEAPQEPTFEFEKITLEQIPPLVIGHFEKQAGDFVAPEDYQPGNFSELFRLDLDQGGLIYGATLVKNYPFPEDVETESLMYIADTDEQGEVYGYGEVRYNTTSQDPYFKDKPFVGFTETEENHRKQGFGMRRLIIMNTLAQKFFGHPLHSDAAINQAKAKPLWERLVEQGLAYEYIEDDNLERYAFK
jgi:hypothetical protein